MVGCGRILFLCFIGELIGKMAEAGDGIDREIRKALTAWRLVRSFSLQARVVIGLQKGSTNA